MKSATRDSATRTAPRQRVSFESGLHLQIGALLQERDSLQEEVRQLRAALQIYDEVVRRLQAAAPQRIA